MGFKPPKDNSAELARQAEEKRQADIARGIGVIDQNFSKFDDSYFDRTRQAALSYYTPQLEDQYENAYKRMVFNLARKGGLTSSEGLKNLADLKELHIAKGAEVAGRADDLVAQKRAEIEGLRSNLVNQLNVSADPAAAEVGALAAAQQAARVPTYSPLIDAFGPLISETGRALRAEREGRSGFGTGLFKPKETAATVVA